MSRLASRGALIVLEGCDRSGKTTQCKKLVEALKSEGRKVEFWRYPERTTAIGKVINDYLERKCEMEDHAVHLLFAANRWESVPKMKQLLLNGTTLVVDRYSFSGVAFSGAKECMNLDWCVQPEIGLPEPDAVIYLALSAESAAERASFGGERYEQTDFQKRVAANYEVLKEPNWKYVDASKDLESLHIEIKHLANLIMSELKTEDIGKLWLNKSSASNKKAADEPNPPAKRTYTENGIQTNGIQTNGIQTNGKKSKT